MTRLPIDLRDLHLLDTVIQEGSFSAAARALSLSRLEVSRSVARLEQVLDARLFARTTRLVVPTEAARELIARLRPALGEIDAALGAVAEGEQRMAGPVHISCSHAMGHHVLLPELARFQAQHPEVELVLSLSDQLENLVARELDLALRIGPLPPSSLIARRLGRVALSLVAPADWAEPPARIGIEDLRHYPAILFHIPSTGDPYLWRLHDGRQETPIRPARVVARTDSVEAVAGFVREGVGVALAPRYLVARDLAEGRVRELTVTDGRFIGPEVHLCYTRRDRMPRRVRALCDQLIERLPRGISGSEDELR